MHKSDILKSCFGAATFVEDLNSWILISEKIAYKTFFTVRFRLAILRLHFSGPYSVGNLPRRFKIIHPGLITSDYIIKSLFTIFWVHFEKFFAIVLRASSFALPLTNGVSILHLSF